MEIFPTAAVFVIHGTILFAGLVAQIPALVGLGYFFSLLAKRGDSS